MVSTGMSQIDATDYPLMQETLPEHSRGCRSAPEGCTDEAQPVMAAGAIVIVAGRVAEVNG